MSDELDPAPQPLPDLIDSRYPCRLLFVGINPSLWSAHVGAHFARPGNRFWPALAHAGITHRVLDMSNGETEEDRRYLLTRGLGITNLASRPTARAEELSRAELDAGRAHLAALVQRHQPRVVAVAGLTAYRTAFSKPQAKRGRQSEDFGTAELWLVPNPSGLNARESIESLAGAYAAPARAAGVLSGQFRLSQG